MSWRISPFVTRQEIWQKINLERHCPFLRNLGHKRGQWKEQCFSMKKAWRKLRLQIHTFPLTAGYLNMSAVIPQVWLSPGREHHGRHMSWEAGPHLHVLVRDAPCIIPGWSSQPENCRLGKGVWEDVWSDKRQWISVFMPRGGGQTEPERSRSSIVRNWKKTV